MRGRWRPPDISQAVGGFRGDGLEVARGGAGLEPGEEAEAFRAGLEGQLIFAVAEAADGKRLTAVQMVLPAEFHGENHLAFAGKDGMHGVRWRLTFATSRPRPQAAEEIGVVREGEC